jgi:AcrR family transcriptional regulator
VPDLSKPRSVRAHDAVLAATRTLLAQGGYRAATIDAISGRSGVSKATIYNHWPSRAAVAAEAFGAEMAEATPPPETGSARRDLTEHVRRVAAFYSSKWGAIFAELLAAGVDDEHGQEYFRRYFLDARRDNMRGMWARAQACGEARPEIDADVAQDVLVGALIFRLVTGHGPIDSAEAERIADAALDGLMR